MISVVNQIKIINLISINLYLINEIHDAYEELNIVVLVLFLCLFICFFSFKAHSKTLSCSLTALVLLISDQSRYVGRNTKLMFSSGCHWKIDPPRPIQPTQLS